MPFYDYITEEGEEKELFLSMSEFKEEVEIEGKKFYFKPHFSGRFILKGQGWAYNDTATAGKPKHFKEVGVAIDWNKKRAYDSVSKNKNPNDTLK